MFAPRYFPIRYFPPRYFPNGDSPTVEVLAVMSEITNAVVTQIEGLALSGVTDANVIRVKRPVNPLSGAAPVDVGIQVFSINQQDVGGTNERDDTAYRIGIREVRTTEWPTPRALAPSQNVPSTPLRLSTYQASRSNLSAKISN